MQPFLANYNPAFVAALRAWVPHAHAAIYNAINPIILDGNANGGNYNAAIIAQQTVAIQEVMAHLNAFRNPINLPRHQVPFTEHI